jgi:hypothetical protein
MHTRIAFTLLALIVVAAACGGNDDATTATSATTATTGAPGTAPTSTAAPDTGAETTPTTATTEGGDAVLPACDALLGLDEAADLFGEPAVFDAEESRAPAGISATVCVWTSVEDPDDLEDLQVQILQVHVYRGAQFYAPDLTYDEFERLDGIGDEAYVTGDPGVSAGFLDGEVAGFVDFTVVFPQDAPEAITKQDRVIDLLRLVHDRIS